MSRIHTRDACTCSNGALHVDILTLCSHSLPFRVCRPESAGPARQRRDSFGGSRDFGRGGFSAQDTKPGQSHATLALSHARPSTDIPLAKLSTLGQISLHRSAGDAA